MSEKHLSREQLAALIERAEPLSDEAAAHLEGCPRCLALLEAQAGAGALLPTRTHADDATIGRIAERSFAYLTSERRLSLRTSFSLPRIALGAAAAMLLLIVAYLGLGTTDSVEEHVVAENAPAPAPALAEAPKEFEKGAIILHGRARITVHRDATLSAKEPDRIALARGTVEVSVEKGGDFRIEVTERYLVRVLGTRFILESEGTQLKVTVIEGLVEVIDKETSRSIALSASMEHLFGSEPRLAGAPAIGEKTKNLNSVPIAEIETEISFLQRGRTAIKNGDEEEALRWFRKELAEGTEKDKALFEIVRIFEKDSRFGDILALMKEHRDLVDGDSAYREELLIKACKAEVQEQVGTLPACRKYLRLFPDGYKHEEIRRILESGDER